MSTWVNCHRCPGKSSLLQSSTFGKAPYGARKADGSGQPQCLVMLEVCAVCLAPGLLMVPGRPQRSHQLGGRSKRRSL